MRSRALGSITAAALSLAALVAISTERTTTPAHPSAVSTAASAGIDPSRFVRHVTNPFFPLKPGTTFLYRGVSEGETQIDRVHVTFKTKRILGVRTTVVRDVVRHGTQLLERTFDWFAQDEEGNVWYFGENTTSFENGKASKEGSWQAGVDGARPGIVMEADPHASDGYRQEVAPPDALDQAWVLRRGGEFAGAARTFRHVLVTVEWTPLESRIFSRKIYAKGIGQVAERAVTGPVETFDLVRVHHASG